MLSVHKKKEKEKQNNDLTVKLKSLEIRHMKFNDNDILNQISDTKQTLNNIYKKQVKKS